MGIAVLDQSDGLVLPALVLTTCAVDIPEKKCQKSAKDRRIAITPRYPTYAGISSSQSSFLGVFLAEYIIYTIT